LLYKVSLSSLNFYQLSFVLHSSRHKTVPCPDLRHDYGCHHIHHRQDRHSPTKTIYRAARSTATRRRLTCCSHRWIHWLLGLTAARWRRRTGWSRRIHVGSGGSSTVTRIKRVNVSIVAAWIGKTAIETGIIRRSTVGREEKSRGGCNED
jgi:hypothetical protein